MMVHIFRMVRLGFFPFTKHEVTQRNNRNKVRGTMFIKPIDNITKKKSLETVSCTSKSKEKKSIFPIDDITITDNAKPHVSNNDPEFRVVASSDGFNIQLIYQSANSSTLITS
ncbi:hypothetical protein ACS0TY_003538 [Phlomoides rotata]